MVKKRSKVNKKQEDDKLLAFVATFLSIIGFLIALLAWRDKKYVMFYAKQSLVVFVIAVIAGVIQGIFMWIPILGNIISMAVGIVVFLLWLFSWIYALSGKEQYVPVVGYWADKIDL